MQESHSQEWEYNPENQKHYNVPRNPLPKMKIANPKTEIHTIYTTVIPENATIDEVKPEIDPKENDITEISSDQENNITTSDQNVSSTGAISNQLSDHDSHTSNKEDPTIIKSSESENIASPDHSQNPTSDQDDNNNASDQDGSNNLTEQDNNNFTFKIGSNHESTGKGSIKLTSSQGSFDMMKNRNRSNTATEQSIPDITSQREIRKDASYVIRRADPIPEDENNDVDQITGNFPGHELINRSSYQSDYISGSEPELKDNNTDPFSGNLSYEETDIYTTSYQDSYNRHQNRVNAPNVNNIDHDNVNISSYQQSFNLCEAPIDYNSDPDCQPTSNQDSFCLVTDPAANSNTTTALDKISNEADCGSNVVVVYDAQSKGSRSLKSSENIHNQSDMKLADYNQRNMNENLANNCSSENVIGTITSDYVSNSIQFYEDIVAAVSQADNAESNVIGYQINPNSDHYYDTVSSEQLMAQIAASQEYVNQFINPEALSFHSGTSTHHIRVVTGIFYDEITTSSTELLNNPNNPNQLNLCNNHMIMTAESIYQELSDSEINDVTSYNENSSTTSSDLNCGAFCLAEKLQTARKKISILKEKARQDFQNDLIRARHMYMNDPEQFSATAECLRELYDQLIQFIEDSAMNSLGTGKSAGYHYLKFAEGVRILRNKYCKTFPG